MKTITILLLTILPFISNSQDKCDNFPAVSLGYVFSKTATIGIDYFSKIGITGGAGIGYSFTKPIMIKQGENVIPQRPNQFDIYSYIGYRIIKVDYKISVFINGGWILGDVDEASAFTSIKLLFPIKTRAISVEPIYILNRGFTTKLALNLKF